MSEMKASARELETLRASLDAIIQERDTLTGRLAELERKLAPPVPTDPIQALLASASPEQRAALERIQAEAAAAEVLRGQTRPAGFVAKAHEIGAGSKLPIKADALGGITPSSSRDRQSASSRWPGGLVVRPLSCCPCGMPGVWQSLKRGRRRLAARVGARTGGTAAARRCAASRSFLGGAMAVPDGIQT